MGDQRRAGVKPEVQRTGHEGVASKARVNCRIRNNKRSIGLDREIAECHVSPGFGYVKPDTAFEPLTGFIDETDQSKRTAEHPGC